MPANSSIVLTNLDFDALKNSLKAYLKSQDRFKDYDFDGSNMSVLLDVLTYNTYYNGFYLNMIGSEMFLDTAQIRDSVVSHAKELNYTPRSFTSAQAEIDLIIVASDPAKTAITIPRGTAFSTRVDNQSFTFTTDQNISITGSGTFVANSVVIYEGDIITETFSINNSVTQNFILSNENIDTSSINVTILEDGGATVLEYLRAISLFGYDETSEIFFIQGAAGDKFEIVFGDDVIGRKPKDNSTMVVEYRLTNGELPNGASLFSPVAPIDGETNIVIITEQAAHSGTVSEDIDSIRFNAPRHFTTQERAITTEDYENLLRINFPEINAVTAFGGEDLSPPIYGKVFVSVDLNDIDGIPDVKKQQYYDFLKPRCPLSTDPVIVDPEQMFIGVTTTVRYNINLTALNQEDVKSLIISAILNYSNSHLNGFAKTLRFSRLTTAIDDADESVVSNETFVKAIKTLVPPTTQVVVSFGIPIKDLISSEILFNNRRAILKDDGAGTLVVVSAEANQQITQVGQIDYATGSVQLTNFVADAYPSGLIKLFATPVSSDISTNKNVVLNIEASDIQVTIEKIRE